MNRILLTMAIMAIWAGFAVGADTTGAGCQNTWFTSTDPTASVWAIPAGVNQFVGQTLLTAARVNAAYNTAAGRWELPLFKGARYKVMGMNGNIEFLMGVITVSQTDTSSLSSYSLVYKP